MRCRPLQLLLLAGAAAAASGQVQPQVQDGGPVLVGVRHDSWAAFELEHMQAALEVLGQYRYDRQKQSSGQSLTDREKLLRETFDLSGEASIGHKNLLDLTGTLQIGLEDRWSDSQTADLHAHESDLVDLYDVRGLILGNGPVPTTIYSRREQNLLDRAFAGTIEQTTNETGIISQLRSERAPTTFQYFHREQDLSDRLGQTSSSTVQDTFTLQSGIRITEGQRLDVGYTFDSIQEEQPGFFSDSYDRHDANIVHTVDFGGEDRPNELRSSLRVYDQSGQFSQDDVRIDELLLLRHSDRLETRYNLTYDEQHRGDSTQRLTRGEASIRHRLFESLTSTASVGVSRLEAPEDFSSTDFFTTGQLDYVKTVPLGRVNASAGVSYDAQHNSEQGGTLSVLNEQHVFNDPFPIVLSRRNIVPGSIVLTPLAGFPVFIEGTDYTVQIFPDRAEIRVPPGSPITDGSTVLASYDIGPEPENDIDTTGTSVTFRYTLTEGTLEGLSAYTTYRTLDHSLSAADPSRFVLDDTRNLLLGLEYIRAGLDVKLEREDQESTVEPFVANRLQAMYLQPLGRDSSLNFDFTHETVDYSLRDNRLVFDRVTAKWIQRLNQALDFNIRLEYRDEHDNLRGNSQALDQILGFTWRKAQTTIYGSVRNGFLNGPASDTTSQFLQIGVRRAF